jgi:predicted RNA polymerase sigma factor
MITEGSALVTTALNSAPLGPYQVQAAIAAVHSEAPDTASTDWPQILGLCALLEQITPSPVVTLNRAVALAMVYGPQAGLRLLDRSATSSARQSPSPARSPRGYQMRARVGVTRITCG